MTPDRIAYLIDSLANCDPETARQWIAEIERERATWRYRMFASHREREADRCLLERLRARARA